jgi:hypothetical protein
MEARSSSDKATQFTLMNLGMAGLTIAWLAVACYAVAYLVSH